jgi:hypothetical protein
MGRQGKILGYSILTIVLLLAIAISLTIGWRPIIGTEASTPCKKCGAIHGLGSSN